MAATVGLDDDGSATAADCPLPQPKQAAGIVALHADDEWYRRLAAKLSGAAAVVRPMLDVPTDELLSLDFGRRMKEQMLNVWQMSGVVGALIASFCFSSFLAVPERPSSLSPDSFSWRVKTHSSLIVAAMITLAGCVLMSGIWYGFFNTVPATNIVRAIHFFEHFVLLPVYMMVLGACFFLLDLLFLGEIIYADYIEVIWIIRMIGVCVTVFSCIVLGVVFFVHSDRIQNFMRSRGQVQLPGPLQHLAQGREARLADATAGEPLLRASSGPDHTQGSGGGAAAAMLALQTIPPTGGVLQEEHQSELGHIGSSDV